MWNLIPWKTSEVGKGLATTDPVEREFSRIRNDFDSLFERIWGPDGGPGRLAGRLDQNLEIDETDSHYIVRVAAPGFAADEIDVQVSGNQLLIKAERKRSEEDKNGSRRFYGKVQRMVMLPQGTDADRIEADFRNGLLEVKVPKGAESLSKKITVNAA